MTQAVTHTGFETGGVNGAKRAKQYTYSQQKEHKRPQRSKKHIQSAAHNRSVAGSNPVPATNKTLKSQDFSVFLLFSSLFCPICFSDWSLTQTLTRVGTSSGSLSSPPAARLAPSAAPPFQMRPAALGSHLVLSSSQHPCHGLGRLSLGGPGHMGVGIQSEPGGEVAQHAGGRLFQNPAQAQRSGLRRERRSHGMSEPCPDGTGRGIWSWRRRGGARCPGRMGPPFGDGNTHGLLPAFSFCSNRTLTVSSASGRVR